MRAQAKPAPATNLARARALPYAGADAHLSQQKAQRKTAKQDTYSVWHWCDCGLEQCDDRSIDRRSSANGGPFMQLGNQCEFDRLLLNLTKPAHLRSTRSDPQT